MRPSPQPPDNHSNASQFSIWVHAPKQMLYLRTPSDVPLPQPQSGGDAGAANSLQLKSYRLLPSLPWRCRCTTPRKNLLLNFSALSHWFFSAQARFAPSASCKERAEAFSAERLLPDSPSRFSRSPSATSPVHISIQR